MRLLEVLTDPSELIAHVAMQDEIDKNRAPVDIAHKDNGSKRIPARANSNIEKARRIRTMKKLKAKDANPKDEGDTENRSYEGGHGSAFLFR